MDESLGTCLQETKQRIITEIEHLAENEFYHSHYKQKINMISDGRSVYHRMNSFPTIYKCISSIYIHESMKYKKHGLDMEQLDES